MIFQQSMGSVAASASSVCATPYITSGALKVTRFV